MRALRLGETGLTFDREYQPTQQSDHEVPIRVTHAGVCETDIQLERGYMGFQGVLGHEFVGVAESGPFAGQRVVGEINCACHNCATCRAGHPRHCPHRSVLGILNRDGAFADQVWLPPENLHAVPDSVSSRQAVFVEPLAAAFRIPEQIPLTGQERSIILGDGRLGNLCAQVLKPRVAEITVVGKHEPKLEILNQLQIPTRNLNELDIKPVYDLVVDCTGRESGLLVALQLARPLGTVVMKTTIADQHQLSMAALVIDEIQLIGSRCGPFEPALKALESQEVSVEPLISGEFDFDQALDGFQQARDGQGLKTIFRIQT